MRRSLLLLTTFLCASSLGAGCGGSGTDKTGGGAHVKTRVLRLANANAAPVELEPYAREVERASHGRLRIEFVNEWRKGEPDAEPGILDDVGAGKIDLAWVGARAFSGAGVTAFDPLIAPFAVTDYATEERVLRSPVAAAMLEAAASTAVRPIALLPGPLQMLGMRRPWRRARDLAGKRIGSPAGIGRRSLQALGAEPVAIASGGSVDGVDGHIVQLLAFEGNRYPHEIPYIATGAFWVRPLVVVAGSGVWQRLSEEERNVLLEAGRAAIGPVLDHVRATQQGAIRQLCRMGARFLEADAVDLRRAVEPVYAAMRRDVAAAKTLEAVEALRSPDESPQITCPKPNESRAGGGLPEGTYRWSITRAEAERTPGLAAASLAEYPASFRAVIEDRHIVIHVRVAGSQKEEIGFESDFSVFKDRVEFGAGGGEPPVTARWKLQDGDLRFSDVHGPGPGDSTVFATNPWRRVG
jgi:TRAP-type C4-dicarboxylate transport system substrate-binding protein